MRDYFIVLLVLALGNLFGHPAWAQRPEQPSEPPQPAVHQSNHSESNITINVNDNNGERETQVRMSTADGSTQAWRWTGSAIPDDIRHQMERAGVDVTSFEEKGQQSVSVHMDKHAAHQIQVNRNDDITRIDINHQDGGKESYSWEGEMPASIAERIKQIDAALYERLHDVVPKASLGAEINVSIEEAITDIGGKVMTSTIVSRVDPNGPADRAGLMSGDEIIRFDGETLSADLTIADLLRTRSPGQEVNLVIKRDGVEREILLKLGQK